MQKKRRTSSLTKEIHDATLVLKEVEEQSEQIVKSQSFFHKFIGGLLSTLGALVGAAIVIPFVLSVLQQIQWVPIIGDALARILMQAEHVQQRAAPAADDQ